MSHGLLATPAPLVWDQFNWDDFSRISERLAIFEGTDGGPSSAGDGEA
jgi:hypothetical protein